jgi:tRNA (guanine37-N1)-methyltransferase
MFPGTLDHALAGRALEHNIWQLDVVNIRDFATDKHRTVDDAPLGGGPGMILRADVIDSALGATAEAPGPRFYPSPRGRRLTQSDVRALSKEDGAVFVCGRFEGIDQRVIDKHDLIEISIGDYILSGGELATQVILDSCIRLLPGVMGNHVSHEQESFETGLLEHPNYTHPRIWQGMAAPEILGSGHHVKIANWRQKQAETITQDRRPDLWQNYLDNKA